MRRKKHTAEEIVAKLCWVDVLVAQGRKVVEAIRSIPATHRRFIHSGSSSDVAVKPQVVRDEPVCRRQRTEVTGL